MPDDDYWLAQEEAVLTDLVDLADRGFACRRRLHELGLSEDPRCRVRPGVADALERAREHLPPGFAFLLWEGLRSWPEQQLISDDYRQRLEAAHPDWDPQRIDDTLAVLAPRQRLIRRFDKHRYGGAVDITLLDAAGERCDMGEATDGPDPERCRLLHYEMRPVEPDEEAPREHRRILLRAMEAAGFEPYLAEWWHWGYSRDLASA